MSITYTIQVTWLVPGTFGGAIFKGIVVGQRKKITCIASYKNIDRAPTIGEFWKVTGELTRPGMNGAQYEKYGQQFEVQECVLTHLPSTDYVSSLLVRHPAFRGFYFGAKKIKKLIDHVGSDSLVDLLNHGKTTELSDILHPEIAEKLVKSWASLKNEIDTVNFLREHKFDAALSRKVMRMCKSNTVERLKINPYALICFGGITKNIWRTVEVVARKLKIGKDDERRLIAAVEHVLYERLRVGHTAIEKLDLIIKVGQVLKDDDKSEQAIAFALRKKAICVLTEGDKTLLQLIGPAYIESSIEKQLEYLQTGKMQQSLFYAKKATISFQVELCVAEFKKEYDFAFSDEQLQAINLGLNERCSLISGYGGTGKTTVLRAITDIAGLMNRKVYLMALAGKAKERMAQATNHDAMTIHGFIKAVNDATERVDINCDPLIVIDEASMVDIALFNKLLTLFDRKPFSLLTVGDASQLSPVGFGIVWHRMAQSGKIPSVHLTKVYRQMADSPIHQVAMDIRNGNTTQIPCWKGEKSGIFLVKTETKKLDGSLQVVKSKLPNAQILTPHVSERMPDNTNRINDYMQFKMNQVCGEELQGIKLGSRKIFCGDPVIVTENNYELGLFNGTTGHLVSIKLNSFEQQIGIFYFDYIADTVELTVDQMFDIGLQLAYAITIHKSQGSEYEETIVCCATQSPLVERSLIYTAITRAKRLCIIVGTQDKFDAAIKSSPRAETLCVGIDL